MEQKDTTKYWFCITFFIFILKALGFMNNTILMSSRTVFVPESDYCSLYHGLATYTEVTFVNVTLVEAVSPGRGPAVVQFQCLIPQTRPREHW